MKPLGRGGDRKCFSFFDWTFLAYDCIARFEIILSYRSVDVLSVLGINKSWRDALFVDFN